jgi:FkbM family methyltransferase
MVSHMLGVNSGKYYIQIGAGAGDLDPRANFRDGFTEFVKSLSLASNDRVILVEPNPFNILSLQECWKDTENVEIFEIGICTKGAETGAQSLFYTRLDAPHFQVASFNPDHVLKHYPQLGLEELENVDVKTENLTAFLDSVTLGQKIELLALDIEGIDADVLLDTDFAAMNVIFVSFEHLHLGNKRPHVERHFARCGFKYVGAGVDHNGFDQLYQKILQ